MKYTIDEETRELVEALIHLAQIAAQAQIDEDAQDDAYSLMNAVADTFGIERHEVTIDETEHEDGSLTLHIRTDEVKPKPTLTVISNDNLNTNDNSNTTDTD